MYKLVICDDEGKTTVVPLIRDEVTIGRKEGNTIRLTDRNVSRFHARVVRQEEGFRIEDLGSMCGTKVNTKLLKSDSEAVSQKDKISIGDYSLSIRTDVSSTVPLGEQIEPGSQTGLGKITPHARLVMLTNPKPGYEINLKADLYVIGRSEEANCRIHDPSISRAHARIDNDDGKWTISDLASIDGILINGLRKDDYLLKRGDVITLGAVQLRFVAPGEPYDFDPEPSPEEISAGDIDVETQIALPPPARSTQVPLILGISAVVIAAVIGAAIVLRTPPSALPEKSAEASITIPSDTYESLVEKGKDKIQSEEWTEAARLFALALQKNPNSTTAREMKKLAIQESDAQSTFQKGLTAQQSGNWKEALTAFEAIPRTSLYYDIEQLKKISSRLCDRLIRRASQAISTGELAEASALLEEIGGIPEVSEECRQQKVYAKNQIRRKETANAAPKPEFHPKGQQAAKPVAGFGPKTPKMKRGGEGRKKLAAPKPKRDPLAKPKPKNTQPSDFERPVNPYE